MKRWAPYIAVGLVLVLVLGGIAYAAFGEDSPDAYEVNGKAVSQSTVDDELAIFRDNPKFAAALIGSQTPIQMGAGSVPWDVTHAWLDYRITTDAAKQELKRRGGSLSQSDLQLTEQSLQTAPGWSGLPKDFRDDLVERTAALDAVVLTIADQSGDELLKLACPSGRFVSHILVDTQEQAAAIKRAIDSGTDFATAAQANSLDSSAQNGGRLGCLDDSQFVEPFATVAATQPLNVVSDPVQTEFGYHLILSTDQAPEGALEQAAFQVFRARAADPKFTKITVAPRYGSWDRRNLSVAPPASPGTPSTTQPAALPTG